jgi:phospholipase A1
MNAILKSKPDLVLFSNLSAILLLATANISIAKASSTVNECILQEMEAANDEVTLGQIRSKCKDEESINRKQINTVGAVEKKFQSDDKNVLRPYTLMAHMPNYFLAAVHNASGFNNEHFREIFNDPSIDLDDTEAQFQLSVKFPVAINLFDKKIDIFAAYSNRSFWQVYNNDQSAPFRDTNHEPEAWIQFRPSWKFGKLTNSVNKLGIVHQSNGRGGILSRSWNRIYANFLFEYDNWGLSIKPWYRIPEGKSEDDNPDIEDYLGYGEIRTAYKWEDQTFSFMVRNAMESGFSKGTVELSWSFPLGDYEYFRGYVQYFNGYGQSLVDYNQHVNSIGIGVSFTDFL